MAILWSKYAYIDTLTQAYLSHLASYISLIKGHIPSIGLWGSSLLFRSNTVSETRLCQFLFYFRQRSMSLRKQWYMLTKGWWKNKQTCLLRHLGFLSEVRCTSVVITWTFVVAAIAICLSVRATRFLSQHTKQSSNLPRLIMATFSSAYLTWNKRQSPKTDTSIWVGVSPKIISTIIKWWALIHRL